MSMTVNQKESLKQLGVIAGANSSIAVAVDELERLEGESARWSDRWISRGVELKGAHDRAKLLFEAKNQWADRARNAEADAISVRKAYSDLKEGLMIPSDKIALEVVLLREELVRVRAQLPEAMQDCTILYLECEGGHGRLTATNWVDSGCDVCGMQALELELEAIGSDYTPRCPKLVTLQDGTTCVRCDLPKDHEFGCLPEEKPDA